MEVIYNPCTDPYFNLAAEEALLCGEDDVFLLWRNASSVIIGKNQNTFAEVNIPFAEKENIKIARRLTGGGAVFHDEGNINYTFITDADGDGIDFARFTEPVCRALESFGVKAELNGRNDLCAEGFKISGNAQCVYDTPDKRKRLLHHGTLLFSADISKMAGALRVNKEKLQSKGIKSVPSRVKNIIDIEGYCGPKTPEGFASALLDFACDDFSATSRELSPEEKALSQRLRDEKFSTWDWNFGKSPLLREKVSRRFSWGTVEIGYTCKNGVIEEVSVFGDFFGVCDTAELCRSLCGCRLIKEDITAALYNVDRYISGAKPEELCELILEGSSSTPV